MGIKIMKDEKGPLVVLIKTPKVLLFVPNFNMEELNKKGVVAVRIAGIDSIKTTLEAKIVEVTSKAKELEIEEGMLTKETLEKLC